MLGGMTQNMMRVVFLVVIINVKLLGFGLRKTRLSILI